METVHRFDHRAMATPWRFSIAGTDAGTAGWAAEQAIAVVTRLEEDLSRFQATSYISQLGRLQAGESLRVSPATFECLELAKAVWLETHGAFDITVRRDLTEGWVSQMEDFALCEDYLVEVRVAGLALDLGGIGKGFALDEIGQLFHENEIAHAFLDAGGSTFLGMGSESDSEEGWPASLGPYGVIALTNQALSASGFEVQGYHVIDPQTGLPVATERQRSWVLTASAALADAMSTAALVMSESAIEHFCQAHSEVTVMLS